MSTPKVSIIIPAYNASRFIEETLQSVIHQDFENWEMIVVNDGSTDNTPDLVSNFASIDSRITLISKQNTGVSDTRNTGMSLAKGEYLALLDADDVWSPQNLSEKVQLLDNNPEIGFVFSDMMQADEHLLNPTLAPIGKDENILEDLLRWNGEVIPGPCSNLIFRRTCLEKGISFHMSLTTIADQHFCVQLAWHFAGKRIPKALWTYRVVKGSMSKSLYVMEKDCLAVYALYDQGKYFKSTIFRRKCFAKMYRILGASWWKDGKKQFRGMKFLCLSVFYNPLGFFGSK
jgi:glycosyltransferase involved in cell wall biosynthesis